MSTKPQGLLIAANLRELLARCIGLKADIDEGKTLFLATHDDTISTKLPADLGAKSAAESLSVVPGLGRYVTFLPDISIAAGGGAGATQFTCEANGEYEIEIWPDWTNGASLSDVVVGVFKEGSAPADDDDGEYLINGQSRRILVAAGATIYVRTRAEITVESRWKCRRVDA